MPLGMFSTAPTIPTTCNGMRNRAQARMAPITVAPPDMSCFIVTMLPLGLSERPPESKVTPLPTSAM